MPSSACPGRGLCVITTATGDVGVITGEEYLSIAGASALRRAVAFQLLQARAGDLDELGQRQRGLLHRHASGEGRQRRGVRCQALLQRIPDAQRLPGTTLGSLSRSDRGVGQHRVRLCLPFEVG